jgi:hypothetical protein
MLNVVHNACLESVVPKRINRGKTNEDVRVIVLPLTWGLGVMRYLCTKTKANELSVLGVDKY